MTNRSTQRAGRRARNGRHRPPSASPESADRPRRFFQRRAVQAGLVFAVLLGAYLTNGDILPGQDATGNVRLAGKILSKRSLAFTPEAEPYMFEWTMTPTAGAAGADAEKRFARFRSWASVYEGETMGHAYARGAFGNPQPMYYVMKTRIPGVYVNKYGLGSALFAVPFVAAVYVFARDIYDRPVANLLWYTTKVAAASAVAGSAVFLFLAALAFMRPGTAAGLALAYGLTTCVWSSSSQTLWQHGPTEFFLALGTLLLLRQNRLRSAPLAGLAYMLAFACRPTAALAVVAAGVYYLVRDRRALLTFAAGCFPVALLLSLYNMHYFGQVVAFGQLGTVISEAFGIGTAYAAASPTLDAANRVFTTSALTGVTGVLLSPSRGLLVFSPALGFAFWGLVRVWRDDTFKALRPASVAAIAMCLVAARWSGWWGGWCFGYRLLVDSVTLLAFCAIPVAEDIRRRRGLFLTCAVLLIWGATVQVVGAFAYDVVGWNKRELFQVNIPGREPMLFVSGAEARQEAWAAHGTVVEVEIDVNSDAGLVRLWSVRDSQILYYLGNFDEARAVKQIAIEQFLRDRG